MIKRYDIIADWHLNEYCNFKCSYCYKPLAARENITRRGRKNIGKIISSFDKTGLIWLIHMSGGEPFLHQDFIKLCRGLTKNHYISINTNLSLPTNVIEKFCRGINPRRAAFIHCSLHITQRASKRKIKLFIKNIHLLKEYNFTTHVSQVMWPPVLDYFGELFAYFKKEQILIKPKNFKGLYKARHYPESYTQKEKETILYFMKKAREDEDSGRVMAYPIDTNIDHKWLKGYVSFRGRLCAAGKDFVSIDYDGTVRRCIGNDACLGNIYKGEFSPLSCKLPCKLNICLCPYYGFKFAIGKPKIIRMNRASAGQPGTEKEK